MAAPPNSKKKFGKVIMFLQQEFEGYDPREEDDINEDIKNISKCFKELDFDVEEPQKNFTEKEIKDRLTREHDSYESTQYKCLVVFFVTHSPRRGQLLCKDKKLYDEELIEMLKGKKRPELTELLKVFVFQASEALGGKDKPYDGSEPSHSKLPDEANFFVIKSSYEREATPREIGSYFLKVFCQHVENSGATPLFNVMSRVLGELKSQRNTKHHTKDIVKRPRNYLLPEVSSTLLEPLYFRSMKTGEGTGDFNQILPRYEDKKNAGRIIVFNYNKSKKTPRSRSKKRLGTQLDVEEITKSFKKIGFKVEVNNDLSKRNLLNTLDEGSTCRNKACMNTTQCGLRHPGDAAANYCEDTCLAVAIMTHGRCQCVQTSDWEISIESVISRLLIMEGEPQEKADLSGKPKVFFLQVCRESHQKDYVAIPPLELDDILMFHSTYQGKTAIRYPKHGTPFIQSICEQINKMNSGETIPLIDLLQNVQKSVARTNPEQMPVIYSTLTKMFFVKGH